MQTASSLTNLLFFLALHPEYQRHVQKELDELVVTGSAIPFSEIQKLPYLNAVWKESLRTATVPLGECHAPFSRNPTELLRLGIPHVAKEDDICNGFFIPKGCIVTGNIGSVICFPVVPHQSSSLLVVSSLRTRGYGETTATSLNPNGSLPPTRKTFPTPPIPYLVLVDGLCPSHLLTSRY